MLYLRRRAGQIKRIIGQTPLWWWLRREIELLRSYRLLPDTPAVYFPYKAIHLHQTWQSTINNPPLTFSPYLSAQLSHFINWGPLNKAEICFVPPFNGVIKKVRFPGRPKPFVVEVEHPLAILGNISDWQWGITHTELINQIMEQDECRAVFTGSDGLVEHGKRYIRSDLWSKLHKVNIAYPIQETYAVPDRPFAILTIATRFYDKGIPEAIEAYRILRERYGKSIRMILVCHVIPTDYSLPDGVELHTGFPMSDEFRRNIYRAADVFLLPVYSDSGGCFVECMAFGVPIVTTRITHGEEIVRDGYNGFLIETPIYSYSEGYGVKWKVWSEFVGECEKRSLDGGFKNVITQSVERVEHLIRERTTLNNMREAARVHHNLNFSIEARNQRLCKIYKNAAY